MIVDPPKYSTSIVDLFEIGFNLFIRNKNEHLFEPFLQSDLLHDIQPMVGQVVPNILKRWWQQYVGRLI
jgi:hypothetical protein